MLGEANKRRKMSRISVIGKFLDQPRLVGKFSQSVPLVMGLGGAFVLGNHIKNVDQEKQKKETFKLVSVLSVTMLSALVSTRGVKSLGIKGLSNNINLKDLEKSNSKLVDEFIKTNKVSEESQKILEKGKNKVLNISEISKIYKELESNKSGKEFLNEFIPEPENITSKDIFSEIKRLSLMGLIPVLGGIIGGVSGDAATDNKWKDKVPNKIKEGVYQYLANIFLCNVGAGIALGVLEKNNIKSKSARAIGMVSGIILTGVIGGSIIANLISKKCIEPLFCSNKKENKNIYSERKPEALDLGLHLDDVATVAVLSGLKWIEPALPILYSISGYRAGIGYRNGSKFS